MDSLQFVGLILKAGERLSIDVSDIGKLCTKLIVLSLKYVDRRALWAKLFGEEDYVDWQLVESDAKGNPVGGCVEWVSLLGYFDWSCLAKAHEHISSSIPALATLRANMKACGLETGDGSTWTVVCKVLVLLMVRGLVTSYCVEVLTCQIFGDTHGSCVQLMAKQAEHLFTPEQYIDAFAFALARGEVDTTALDQTLALARSQMEDRRTALRLQQPTRISGRPSLRDKLSQMMRADDRLARVDIQMWDTFVGFCQKHQFPPNRSEKFKARLYFLACQTRWDWQRHVPSVVGGDQGMCERIASHPVAVPDVGVLMRVIEGLTMDGRPPFREMTEFRRQCFSAFPESVKQAMPLYQILRLYVAAYQPQSVWKECWKGVVGSISNQIILDVDMFCCDNPFAGEEVMLHVLAS